MVCLLKVHSSVHKLKYSALMNNHVFNKKKILSFVLYLRVISSFLLRQKKKEFSHLYLFIKTKFIKNCISQILIKKWISSDYQELNQPNVYLESIQQSFHQENN